MGKRGPRKEPTALKLLKGNPGGRKLNTDEPQPEPAKADDLICPAWVCDEGKVAWTHFAPKAERLGLLTEVDVMKFALLCQAYGLLQKFEALCKTVSDEEAIHKGYRKAADTQSAKADRIGSAFGFDPSSRSGVKVKVPAAKSSAAAAQHERFFGKRGA